MVPLFYARLFLLTAGTLVYLFLIALILGHRRPRFFERLLFFLSLALLAIYGARLLEINAQIQYGVIPAPTRILYSVLDSLGLLFLPALLVHVQVQYLHMLQPGEKRWGWRALVWFFYAAPFVGAITHSMLADSVRPGSVGVGLGGVAAWLGLSGPTLLWAAVLSSVGLDALILAKSRMAIERRFFTWLLAISAAIFVAMAFYRRFQEPPLLGFDAANTGVIALGVVPGALLVYYALKHNFLDFGAQRNLVYALSATLLALLYLGFVHRISGWLAPVFPPEATASVLLFVLIFLFEPLERVMGPALHRTFRARMDRWQRLAVELQDQARNGEVTQLTASSERRIREEFGLAAVRISLPRSPEQPALESPGGLGHVLRIPLSKGSQEMGLLEAASTGSYLTGETSAGLEFIAEQLPAMIDLCRLIEEKLRLERELAERERLAMLGQMAASVSHNLRNPLGSMKTVLQVQLEKPDLPAELRHDCTLVLNEVDRMNAKLSQLLQFAKPAVNGRRVWAGALAKQTAALFRHDAERRQVILEFDAPAEDVSILASEEALSEVLSNLVVNAIEAQPEGGRVRVALARRDDRLEISVEDHGPGVSEQLRARIFQPFFTTKASGTGLGLSIVARRVEEMGGSLVCESPVGEGKGTRFRITLPVEAEGDEAKPVGVD